jgi:hypothetical protein
VAKIYKKQNGIRTLLLTWPDWKYPEQEKVLSHYTGHGEVVNYIMELIRKQEKLDDLIRRYESAAARYNESRYTAQDVAEKTVELMKQEFFEEEPDEKDIEHGD